MAPSKLAQAHGLVQRGCQLGILTDSVAGAAAIAAFGQAHGVAFDTWIEIDSDGHRSGIACEAAVLVDVARALHGGGMVEVEAIAHLS